MGCASIYHVSKVDSSTLSVVDGNAIDHRYLSATNTVESKTGILECIMCHYTVACQGLVDIGTVKLMITMCQCRYDHKMSGLDYYKWFNVAVVDSSHAVVGMLNRNINTTYATGHRIQKYEAIWHDRTRVVYRQGIDGNGRLVVVTKDDIGNGRYDKWEFLGVSAAMTEKPVAHMVLRPNGSHALLWENGKFSLPRDKDMVRDKLSRY